MGGPDDRPSVTERVSRLATVGIAGRLELLDRASGRRAGRRAGQAPRARGCPVELDQARALVDHLDRVVGGVRLHGQIVEGLAAHDRGAIAVDADFADDQVERRRRERAVMLDLQAQEVAPIAGIGRRTAADAPAGADVHHMRRRRRPALSVSCWPRRRIAPPPADPSLTTRTTQASEPPFMKNCWTA